jgi:hypothetical protein
LLEAVVPVARSLSIAEAPPLAICQFFAGLAQQAERRPRNAEAACSIHAAGT